MDGVDWAGLSFLAVLLVACVGYLSRQLNRVEDRLGARIEGLDARGDRLESRMDRLESRIDRLDEGLTAKIDRLEERYVRHLELHAGHSA